VGSTIHVRGRPGAQQKLRETQGGGGGGGVPWGKTQHLRGQQQFIGKRSKLRGEWGGVVGGGRGGGGVGGGGGGAVRVRPP